MLSAETSIEYIVPPILVAVVALVLLSIVWRHVRKRLSGILFCCVLLNIGLVGVMTLLMRLGTDVNDALPWGRAIPICVLGTYVFYYHFTVEYTQAQSQKKLVWIPYLLLLAGILAMPTDLVVERMRLESYGYAPAPGQIGYLIGLVSISLLVGGAFNLFSGYRRSPSYEEKNRIAYLIIATLLPIGGGLIDAFTNLPPVGIWTYLLFIVICSVAVAKFHLLDIQVIARKSLMYLLISAAIAIPYVGIIYSLHLVFESVFKYWWMHVLILLFLAVALRPLYSWAQILVDKLFYRERYDYLVALGEFSKETQSIDVAELSSHIVHLICGAVRASSACLLLWPADKQGLTAAACSSSQGSPPGIVFRKDSPLVKWLRTHGQIVTIEQLHVFPQLQSLSLRETNIITQLGARLFVPIITRDGDLAGVLVLGEKLSQREYLPEDRGVLMTFGNQIAMALDNARLYEEVKHSERILRESEQKLRLIYDSMTDGVITSDLHGKIMQINQAVGRMHKCEDHSELYGKNYSELVSSKDRKTFQQALKTTMKKEYLQDLEITLLTKDGNEFPAELSLAVLQPLSGEPEGFVIVTQDVSERKASEQREKRLQRELELSSRLASIGELAAGVAHELNNPLTGVIGFSERLLRKVKDDAFSRDLQRVYQEAQRAAKVVENLRAFSRRTEPKKEWNRLDDILQKTLEMRLYELRTKNIEVLLELAADLPSVMVDFHQIQQVFLNIIGNAEQAMAESGKAGTLKIKTEGCGDYARVIFADNGPGIPPNVKDKLFDPFFTTRSDIGGTGLGLSICHGIVTEHGGKIYVESDPGQGTRFFVDLPFEPFQ